jgi:hypothetical protein
MKKVTKLVELELVGIDGNAFALMGVFSKAARRQGTPKEEVDAVIKECMSGDYDHLLSTLMENTTSPEEEEEDDSGEDGHDEG